MGRSHFYGFNNNADTIRRIFALTEQVLERPENARQTMPQIERIRELLLELNISTLAQQIRNLLCINLIATRIPGIIESIKQIFNLIDQTSYQHFLCELLIILLTNFHSEMTEAEKNNLSGFFLALHLDLDSDFLDLAKAYHLLEASLSSHQFILIYAVITKVTENPEVRAALATTDICEKAANRVLPYADTEREKARINSEQQQIIQSLRRHFTPVDDCTSRFKP